MKKTWVAVLIITFVAFLLRVYRIDFVSLRGDEAFTVVFVQRTWDGLWKGIRTVEPNPPLMYLALRAWIAIAGASEFVTRYFSAFFGVLCAPLLYRLAREMFSPCVIARSASDEAIPTVGRRLLRFARNDTALIALLAAALIAINPYQIWHSQDVRNYTMWPALSLLALIFFWRWWRLETACHPERSEGSSRHGMRFLASLGMTSGFYVLTSLASLYTHYYDTFILVALNVFVFAFALSERRWKTLARWIAAQAVLVAAYAPWVVWGTNRVTTYGEASAEQSVSLLDQFSRTLVTFVVGETVSDSLKAMVWLPLALALVVILIYLARQNRSRAAFLLLYIAVPTLALYVLSIGRPLFLERYLNGIAPAYYLAFAVGLAVLSNLQFAIRNSQSLIRNSLVAVGLFFFASTSAYALSNYYFDPAYVKSPNWRALAQFIAARQQPGDIVIQNFTEMAPYYYQRETLPVLTLPKDYYGTPADDKTLQQLNQDYRRIWFIPAQPDWWDPGHSAEKYLTRFDEREIDTRVAEFGLQLYLTPREFTSKIMPVSARIANATLVGYRVQGYENRALRFSKGATFTLVLYWRVEDRIEKDFSIFVHLVDASGRVVAQHDGVPAEGVYPTSQWRTDDLIVDPHELKVDAVPGTYSLVAGMYDPTTMVRVPVGNDGDSVSLTQVTITQ